MYCGGAGVLNLDFKLWPLGQAAGKETKSFVRSRSFKQAFCERFGCRPEAYQGRAFRLLLYRRAKLIGPVIKLLAPGFFAEDLRFITELGEAVDLREAKVSAASFQDANAACGGFLRRRFRLRVSGFKATELAREFLS
jgi:hypothetical protein